MSQKGEQTSFLSAFLSYAKVNTPVNVRSMGLLDSKISTDGMKTGNSSPKSGDIKSKLFKKESDLPPEKLTALNTFINSPEKKQQRGKDWLVDFSLETGIKKSPSSKSVKGLKEKQSEEHSNINATMSKSPAKIIVQAVDAADNKSPVKANKSPVKASKSPVKAKKSPVKANTELVVRSPKVRCNRLSLKDMKSSPSQNLRRRIQKVNLRQRIQKDDDPKSESSDTKSRLVRKIKFQKDKNSEMRRKLRNRKRKLVDEPIESDTDSEISFKPKAKRRKVNLADTYKMAPLSCNSPLQTRGRKLANAVRGLHKTITEKRELKKLQKEIKQNRTTDCPVSISKQTRLRELRKRKHDTINSSTRTKHSANENSDEETKETVIKKSRLNLKENLGALKKRKKSVIKKQKLKSEIKIHLNESNKDKESDIQSQILSSKVSGSVSPLKKSLNSKSVMDPIASSFSQLSPKISPAKKFDMFSSPVNSCAERSSPVKMMGKNVAQISQEDSPNKQTLLSFSSSAGTNTQPPQSYRLTASPKVKGLPAVLSLNTLSGIPQQIQGSTFSSVHPGFAPTASSVLPNRMDAQFARYRKGFNKIVNTKNQSNIHRKRAVSRPHVSRSNFDDSKQETYSCNICGKVLTHPGSMRRHRREVHGISKKPGRGGKEFLTVKPGKPPSADIVGQNSSVKTQNTSSEPRHKLETTNKRVHVCDSCGLRYNHRTSLNKHRRIHHNVEVQRQNLGQATSIKHPNPVKKQKMFDCRSCKMRFVSYSSFWTHCKIHAAVTQKKKKLREKGTQPVSLVTQPSSLVTHQKIHSTKNQKIHIAKSCNVHVTKKQLLDCDICGRQLGNAGSLVRHRKTHTQEKPHKCETYGAAFAERFNLKHHQYIHTGERPFKCGGCERHFSQKGSLNLHLKRNHSGSLPATPTPSTSDMGFFCSSPRPNTLSINSNSNSSSTQGTTDTSSQSALDSSIPNTSGHCLEQENENSSQFTKMKSKRTLAETVDLLRHSSNLNGISVFKKNSLKEKTLTPSDDQSRNSSRNSSRSGSPNITPIKSEVLTPSCTPCSTPKKSPSCSPSPSLDRAPVTKINKDQKYLFRKGDTVLAQWHDGLYYLGKILKIDEKSTRCMLQYEDNSKYWSLFKDIHRGAKDGEMICCVCMGDSSEKPNEIVLCDNCGQGYHQNCHSPVVGGSEILDPNDEWCCRKCIFALTMKAGGALKEGKYGEELRKMKLTFPYDLHGLSWDAQHKTNSEQYYCYCGGPGVWYQKMLQCCRCKQWFHETCIQCLKFPLLYADSFYIFVCSSCNFGQEYSKRIHIDWPDLVHISIFNMSMENNLKYYEFEGDIMFWINENWHLLQVEEYDDLDIEQRKELVQDALNKNKSRFKNGNEIRKRYALWGLRARVPPPRTHVTLPIDGLVTDKVMKELKVKGRRSKVFMPIACKTPVTMRHSPLQLRAAARRRMLQQKSPLLLDSGLQMGEFVPEIVSELPVQKKHKVKVPKGPLLDRLIPPLSSYEGHNHPFKYEIEQTMEKIETEQRAAIWNYCLSTEGAEDDSFSTLPDGPPVLVKEEPVEPVQMSGDMSPPLSETSETSHNRGRSKKSDTPKLISAPGIKRSKRLSCQKQTRNTPPQLDENPSLGQQISVQKVRSAKANYLCAFDKLGYGKGMYVLGKRENDEGKLDYLISW